MIDYIISRFEMFVEQTWTHIPRKLSGLRGGWVREREGKKDGKSEKEGLRGRERERDSPGYRKLKKK